MKPAKSNTRKFLGNLAGPFWPCRGRCPPRRNFGADATIKYYDIKKGLNPTPFPFWRVRGVLYEWKESRVKAIFLVLGMTLLTVGFADGGNDALAQPQTVTAGERVAQYLQSLMISAGAILEARKPGDLLNSPEVYRVGVVYEPVEKVIDLSVR